MSNLSSYAVALLATYLLHSSILLLSAAVFCRWLASRWVLQRSLLQLALVGGLLTTTAAMLLPNRGWTWNVQLALTSANDVAPRGDVAPAVPEPARLASVAPQSLVGPQQELAARTEARATSTLPAEQRRAQLPASWATIVVCLWLAVATLLLARMVQRCLMLVRLTRSAQQICSGPVYNAVVRLARRWPLRRLPQVYIGREIPAPMAAGVFVPRLYLPAEFVERLDRQQLEALIAHELAHVARRDPLWSLLQEFFCCCLFLQPLNYWARQRLRQFAEFLADRDAADRLSHGLGLARCLAAYAEWSLTGGRRTQPLGAAAVGMASRPSLLARRVQDLLNHQRRPTGSLTAARAGVLLAASVLLLLTLCGPRVIAEQNLSQKTSSSEGTVMLSSKSLLTALAVTVSMGAQQSREAVAEEEAPRVERAAEIRVDAIPDGLAGFRGMLSGEAVRVQPDEGVLLLKVARIERTWPQNKAQNPRAAIGKTLRFELSREFPRLLERHREFLSTVKSGDRIELEAFVIEGEKLVIVEELKRAATESAASPGETVEEEAGFPAGLRGFSGLLVGKVISKDAEKGEMHLKVYKVARVWRGNRATRAESAVGRTFLIDGISGRWIDTLITLKEGDGVEVEAKHVSGDKLQFLGEGFKKTELPSDEPNPEKPNSEKSTKEKDGDQASAKKTGIPESFVGFSGMLAGKVVAKDVEKGWLDVTVDKVPHVWKHNKAAEPQSVIGRTVRLDGIFGKFLDNLLLLEPGDRVEFEATHSRGETLKFPGEWLKKIE